MHVAFKTTIISLAVVLSTSQTIAEIAIALKDDKQDVTPLTHTVGDFWANEKFHISFGAGPDPALRVSGDALKCPYEGYEIQNNTKPIQTEQ